MTALPSTEDLARLAKAITPGPWRRNLENTVCNQIDGEHHAICTDQFCYAPEDQQDANAEAIALMPALIREVLDRRDAEAGMRALLRAGCDLLADNERLRGALQPFADYMHTDEGRLDLDHNGCELPDDLGVGWIYLNHGDFRRAQAALAQKGGE